MSKWAEDWVRYWSGGASQYYTTTCEDSGILSLPLKPFSSVAFFNWLFVSVFREIEFIVSMLLF